MASPVTDTEALVRLERHKNLVCQDTGLPERELERVFFLFETGALELEDLKTYGIYIDRYR